MSWYLCTFENMQSEPTWTSLLVSDTQSKWQILGRFNVIRANLDFNWPSIGSWVVEKNQSDFTSLATDWTGEDPKSYILNWSIWHTVVCSTLGQSRFLFLEGDEAERKHCQYLLMFDIASVTDSNIWSANSTRVGLPSLSLHSCWMAQIWPLAVQGLISHLIPDVACWMVLPSWKQR